MAVYLVKQLGMSEADSIALFSSFRSWLSSGRYRRLVGDKVLGTKRVILLGAIVLAIGYALVAGSGHERVSFLWVWRLLRIVTACLKLARLLLSTCYEKNTRVWTVHSPCTTCPSTSALLVYDCYAVAGREYGWSVAFALSVVAC